MAPLYDSSRSRLLPIGNDCVECGVYTDWGEIIRGCYARRDGVERKAELLRKQQERHINRRRRQSPAKEDSNVGIPDFSLDTLALDSPAKKTRT